MVRPPPRQPPERAVQLAELDAALEHQPRPWADLLGWPRTIPGLGPRTAQVILAEIGPDLARFPSHRHLAAGAAGRCRNRYLPAPSRRLAARRGPQRAIVAVAHGIVVIVDHLLANGTPCADLGGLYFDARDRAAVRRRAVQRLEGLGYRVALTSRDEASYA